MRCQAAPYKGGLDMYNLDGQLRLLACDGDDVVVVSALLQDAIIPGADMEYNLRTISLSLLQTGFAGRYRQLLV